MTTHGKFAGFVAVKGARQHNLKNIDAEMPRDALAFSRVYPGRASFRWPYGTLYAEAQRRYLESVAPYARRLFDQMGTPEVDSIDGLPPAVALQQQRGSPTTHSHRASCSGCVWQRRSARIYSASSTCWMSRPRDYTEASLVALDRLKASGNSLFVVRA